jgi:nucleoside-triphosphatase THEP1
LKRRGTITFISGSVGTGKTTFCSHVIEAIRNSTKPAWTVKGILAPAVFEGNTKTGIDALDLATGEQRRMAQRRTDSTPGIKTKEWSVNRDTIDWCNRVLHEAVPCDLLVVDELGPLEFERDEGFREGLTALDSGRYRAALAVVRTELLHFAEERWPDAVVHSIQNRDHALASAVQFASKIQR